MTTLSENAEISKMICSEKRIYQHSSHNIVLVDLVYHYGIFSRVHATLQPALSVCPSVGWSVGHVLLFFMILFL